MKHRKPHPPHQTGLSGNWLKDRQVPLLTAKNLEGLQKLSRRAGAFKNYTLHELQAWPYSVSYPRRCPRDGYFALGSLQPSHLLLDRKIKTKKISWVLDNPWISVIRKGGSDARVGAESWFEYVSGFHQGKLCSLDLGEDRNPIEVFFMS